MTSYLVKPNPTDPRLTRRVEGVDQNGEPITTSVPMERPLTLYLNGQEIVTMMTIGDFPDYLGVGYLINQNMLRPDDDTHPASGRNAIRQAGHNLRAIRQPYRGLAGADTYDIALEEIGLANEIGHKPLRWPVIDVARGANLQDAPLVHDRDAV